MWENLVTGGGIIVVVGAMLKVVWNKLGCKQEKDMCAKNLETLEYRLSEGSKKFQALDAQEQHRQATQEEQPLVQIAEEQRVVISN